MIARWMLASMLFALLVGIAAQFAERALKALGRPTRLPWTLALVIALTWPVIAALVPGSAPSATAVTSAPFVIESEMIGIAARTNAAAWVERLDGLLIALWAVASTAMLGRVFRAVRTLRHARHEARPAEIDGESVLVTESLGPAVVGVRKPRIVVPEWLLQLDAPLRSLVLRHEREHCRAGDTGLVWLGVVATVLVPWNAAVWWIARRLRLAMEIDCDVRTLRGAPRPTQYAKLLLLIAQRQSSASLVPMLAESSSHLGRRISAMRSAPESHPVLRATALCALAVVAVLVACSPRIASNLTGPVPASAPTATATATTAATPTSGGASSTATPTTPFFDFQVNKPATLRPGTRGPTYPPELRAARVEGQVLAQFVVNSDGAIDSATFKVLKSDNPLFTDAVRAALSSMLFLPAESNGRKVRQLIQLPLQFSLSDGGSLVEIRQPSALSAATAGVVQAPPLRADIPTPPRGQAPTTRAAGDDSRPYFDFQTTRPATMVVGSVGPLYPPSLRAAGVEGSVLAQFVVDETGTADMRTFKVLKSDHPEFDAAVKESLTRMRFRAADVNGKTVKQLLQMPFQFNLSR